MRVRILAPYAGLVQVRRQGEQVLELISACSRGPARRWSAFTLVALSDPALRIHSIARWERWTGPDRRTPYLVVEVFKPHNESAARLCWCELLRAPLPTGSSAPSLMNL